MDHALPMVYGFFDMLGVFSGALAEFKDAWQSIIDPGGP